MRRSGWVMLKSSSIFGRNYKSKWRTNENRIENYYAQMTSIYPDRKVSVREKTDTF